MNREVGQVGSQSVDSVSVLGLLSHSLLHYNPFVDARPHHHYAMVLHSVRFWPTTEVLSEGTPPLLKPDSLVRWSVEAFRVAAVYVSLAVWHFLFFHQLLLYVLVYFMLSLDTFYSVPLTVLAIGKSSPLPRRENFPSYPFFLLPLGSTLCLGYARRLSSFLL